MPEAARMILCSPSQYTASSFTRFGQETVVGDTPRIGQSLRVVIFDLSAFVQVTMSAHQHTWYIGGEDEPAHQRHPTTNVPVSIDNAKDKDIALYPQ
eukprot:scaffold1697_cov180-Amphora_coffeaeformis.AAC.21